MLLQENEKSSVETATVGTATDRQDDIGAECILCGKSQPKVRSTGIQPEVTSIYMVEEISDSDSETMLRTEIDDNEGVLEEYMPDMVSSVISRATPEEISSLGQRSIELKTSALPDNRRKSGIRFLRSIHVQTDSDISRNATRTSEVSTQSKDVEKQERRVQTRLSSIDSSQIKSIKEIQRKVKRIQEMMTSSVQSARSSILSSKSDGTAFAYSGDGFDIRLTTQNTPLSTTAVLEYRYSNQYKNAFLSIDEHSTNLTREL